MCGLAGYFGRRRPGADVTDTIIRALRPRGPDAQAHAGFDHQGQPTQDPNAPARLIHTRLAIRELTPAGAQPMSSGDAQVWLVYNGEVYDWEQYEAELAAAGHPMQSRSDTEFILKGYQAWGLEKLLPRLRGMFAFALLDLRQQAVYLVRDRLGIKPLLYFHQNGELAFGSLLRSVIPYLTPAERELSPSALDAFLAHRTVPAPMTTLASVKRLPAAHFARFDLSSGDLSLSRYWTPESATASQQDLQDTIRDAIDLRLVSDRPVGLFLSGGIDSSTVASCLHAGGHQDIIAFTAQFPGSDFDESPLAERIAQHLNLPQHSIPVSPDPAADFEQLIADLDEPFADPSALPLWSLSRETVKQVPVVLGGDGGDELFGGYKRYLKHRGKAWRGTTHLPWSRRAPRQFPERGDKILDELHMGWAEAYSLRFSGLFPAQRRWLQPDLDAMPATHWVMPDNMPSDPMQAMLEIDRLNYLPEYILRKSDLCTSGHGLEARVPLLDHRLFEQVQTLPNTQRFTDPAKQALLPNCSVCSELDLFNQPKRGFNPPISDWLKGPLAELLPDLPRKLEQATGGQLPATRSQSLLGRFARGETRYGEQVLQLLMLQASLDQIAAIP